MSSVDALKKNVELLENIIILLFPLLK